MCDIEYYQGFSLLINYVYSYPGNAALFLLWGAYTLCQSITYTFRQTHFVALRSVILFTSALQDAIAIRLNIAEKFLKTFTSFESCRITYVCMSGIQLQYRLSDESNK